MIRKEGPFALYKGVTPQIPGLFSYNMALYIGYAQVRVSVRVSICTYMYVCVCVYVCVCNMALYIGYVQVV
jgi:hypothetical protein